MATTEFDGAGSGDGEVGWRMECASCGVRTICYLSQAEAQQKADDHVCDPAVKSVADGSFKTGDSYL